jgi:hypothetical protein
VRHVSSNIIMSDTKQPLSNLYTVLEGKHSTVLVFGFIYNLLNPSLVVTVQHVEKVVKQKWFKRVLTQEVHYDAILVMAHMGTDDPSVKVIRDEIRMHVGDKVPIQFITGHTHHRRYALVDDLSASFEAGRYLDTVGFVSFPTGGTVELAGGNATHLFQHVFLDANVETLQETLMTPELATPLGEEVSGFIQRTQRSLGLDKKIGCAPQDYYVNRSLEEEDSLWRLYRDEVVPTQLGEGRSTHRAILVHQGSWRYDLLEGDDLVYDDIVSVSPFSEPVYLVGKMLGSLILRLNRTLNFNATPFYNTLPEYILAGTIDPNKHCELYCHHFELDDIIKELKRLNSNLILDPVAMINLTSTSIWTSFVLDQWPCPGEKGIPIPWLDNGNKTISGEADPPSKWLLGALLTFGIIFLCGGLFACWVCVDQFCWCGSTTVFDHGELEAMNEEEIDGEFT